MAHISDIKHMLSPRVYKALDRAGETDLDKIAAQGELIQHTDGVGRYGFARIARALAAYESEHGVQLARPFQHPLVEFGLSGKVAKRLVDAGLSTVQAVLKKGILVRLEPGIAGHSYAEITKAIEGWLDWHDKKLQEELEAAADNLSLTTSSLDGLMASFFATSNVVDLSSDEFALYEDKWREHFPPEAEAAMNAAAAYRRAYHRLEVFEAERPARSR